MVVGMGYGGAPSHQVLIAIRHLLVRVAHKVRKELHLLGSQDQHAHRVTSKIGRLSTCSPVNPRQGVHVRCVGAA
jgi:hypothetical protein